MDVKWYPCPRRCAGNKSTCRKLWIILECIKQSSRESPRHCYFKDSLLNSKDTFLVTQSRYDTSYRKRQSVFPIIERNIGSSSESGCASAGVSGPGREVNGHSHEMFCCCLPLRPFPWARRTAVLHLRVATGTNTVSPNPGPAGAPLLSHRTPPASTASSLRGAGSSPPTPSLASSSRARQPLWGAPSTAVVTRWRLPPRHWQPEPRNARQAAPSSLAAACSTADGRGKRTGCVCLTGGPRLRTRILQECHDTRCAGTSAATRRPPSSAGSPTGRGPGQTRDVDAYVGSCEQRGPARPAPSPPASLAPGRRDRGRLAAGPPHDGGGLRPGAGARRSPLR